MTKTSEFARALENAIDELKEKGYTDDDVILDCEGNEITQNEIVCSLLAEQVVEALEKQIAKKPILDTIFPSGVEWYRCPKCKHNGVEKVGCYCHNCGQALDWSDTE
jgi:hypothetical protein